MQVSCGVRRLAGVGEWTRGREVRFLGAGGGFDVPSRPGSLFGPNHQSRFGGFSSSACHLALARREGSKLGAAEEERREEEDWEDWKERRTGRRAGRKEAEDGDCGGAENRHLYDLSRRRTSRCVSPGPSNSGPKRRWFVSVAVRGLSARHCTEFRLLYWFGLALRVET